MAYTPPSGNGVAFQFTGVAYTPPAGGSIDFSSITPTGVLTADLPLTSHFFCSVDLPPITAFVKSGLPLTGLFSAEASAFGVINAALPLSCSLSGVGVVECVLSDTILISGAIPAFAATGGSLSCSIPLSCTLAGWVPYSAELSAGIPITCTFTGYVAPLGQLSARIKLTGELLGQRGNEATVSGTVQLSGELSANAGRPATLNGHMPVYGQFAGHHGIGGTLNGFVALSGDVQAIHNTLRIAVLGAELPLYAELYGLHPVPTPIWDARLSVVTRQQRIEVFTDV